MRARRDRRRCWIQAPAGRSDRFPEGSATGCAARACGRRAHDRCLAAWPLLGRSTPRIGARTCGARCQVTVLCTPVRAKPKLLALEPSSLGVGAVGSSSGRLAAIVRPSPRLQRRRGEFCCASMCPTTNSGETWSHWHGPDGSGVAPLRGLRSSWLGRRGRAVHGVAGLCLRDSCVHLAKARRCAPSPRGLSIARAACAYVGWTLVCLLLEAGLSLFVVSGRKTDRPVIDLGCVLGDP